mgnify:CR=1 FL=1
MPPVVAGEKKQLAYILGRHGLILDLAEGPAAVEDEELREALQQIISNTRLSEQYLSLARDLDVMEAKTPEDVYKMHLVDGRAPAGGCGCGGGGRDVGGKRGSVSALQERWCYRREARGSKHASYRVCLP